MDQSYYCCYSYQPPEREHLFEKALTPSDVGKLNRLVIPKQHAERHFTLDSETGEKGLLLSFEDECGKPWRFRYSYWTSSQSYVLTKGWSRFVKEKRLDTGDAVLFERRRANADRLYIGWRRRGEPPVASPRWGPVLYGAPQLPPSPQQDGMECGGGGGTRTVRLFGVNLECATASHELHHRSSFPLVERQFLL